MTRPRKPAATGPQSFGEGPISIRSRFEKFPASVKGAFVVRGEDTDPHQVSIVEARVARFPGGQGRPIGVDSPKRATPSGGRPASDGFSGVHTGPGATAFTRIPRPMSACARLLVKALIAPLVAE